MRRAHSAMSAPGRTLNDRTTTANTRHLTRAGTHHHRLHGAQLLMAVLFCISFSFATKRKRKLLAIQHHRIAQYLS